MLHVLIGCDTVSAFAAKGKWRPLQMIAKNQTFLETMKDIGKEWSLSNETGVQGNRGRSVQVSIRFDMNFIAQSVAKLSQKHSRHGSHHCDSMSCANY